MPAPSLLDAENKFQELKTKAREFANSREKKPRPEIRDRKRELEDAAEDLIALIEPLIDEKTSQIEAKETEINERRSSGLARDEKNRAIASLNGEKAGLQTQLNNYVAKIRRIETALRKSLERLDEMKKKQAERKREEKDDLEEDAEDVRDAMEEGMVEEEKEPTEATVTMAVARHSFKKGDTITTEEGIPEGMRAGANSKFSDRFSRILKKNTLDYRQKTTIYGSQFSRTIESGVSRMLGVFMKPKDLKVSSAQELVKKFEKGIDIEQNELLGFGLGSGEYEKAMNEAHDEKLDIDFFVKESDEAALAMGERPENATTFTIQAGNVATMFQKIGKEKLEGLSGKTKKDKPTTAENEDLAFITSHQTVLECFLYKALLKKYRQDEGVDAKTGDARAEAEAKAVKRADQLLALLSHQGFKENQGYTMEATKDSTAPTGIPDVKLKIYLDQIPGLDIQELEIDAKTLNDIAQDGKDFQIKLEENYAEKLEAQREENESSLESGVLKEFSIEGHEGHWITSWMHQYLPVPETKFGLSDEGVIGRLWARAKNWKDNKFFNFFEGRASVWRENKEFVDAQIRVIDKKIETLEGKSKKSRAENKELEKLRVEKVKLEDSRDKAEQKLSKFDGKKFKRQENINSRTEAIRTAIEERIGPQMLSIEQATTYLDQLDNVISEKVKKEKEFSSQIRALEMQVEQARRGTDREKFNLLEADYNRVKATVKTLRDTIRTEREKYSKARVDVFNFSRPINGWKRIAKFYGGMSERTTTYDSPAIEREDPFQEIPGAPEGFQIESEKEIELPKVDINDYLGQVNILLQSINSDYEVTRGELATLPLWKWKAKTEDIEKAVTGCLVGKKIKDVNLKRLFAVARRAMQFQIERQK